MECVYLLQELDFDGTPTGLYKIGKTTKDTEQRKKQYKAGNARRVDVYFTVKVYDFQAIETALHHRLSAYRLALGGGDEWFNFRGVDLRSVIRLMEEYEAPLPQQQPTPTYTYYREPSFSDIHPAIPAVLVMGAIFVVGGMLNGTGVDSKLKNHYRQAYIPLETYTNRSGSGEYNTAAINFRRLADAANDECLINYGNNMAEAALEADKLLRESRSHSQAWNTFRGLQGKAWEKAKPCQRLLKKLQD